MEAKLCGKQVLLTTFGIMVFVLVQGVLCSDIKRLAADLLRDYDPDVRPVLDYRNSTVIHMEVYPMHVTDLDEHRGILTLETFIDMSWKDEFLQWNPEQYGGLKEIRIDENKLWKPDVMPHERRGSKSLHWFPVKFIVNNTGNVLWLSVATLELVCGYLDYTNYPRDKQLCIMTIGSWTSNVKEVDFQTKQTNFTEYETGIPQNARWRMATMSTTRFEQIYGEYDPIPYAEVEITLELERQESTTAYVSSVTCTFARALLLFVFLAEDSTRKCLFACTSFLAQLIIASIIVGDVPTSTVTPTALSRVTSSLVLCVAVLLVDFVLSVLVSVEANPPHLLHTLSDSSFCRWLVIGHKTAVPTSVSLDDDREQLKEQELNPKRQWKFLAAILHRSFCAVFLILIFAV